MGLWRALVSPCNGAGAGEEAPAPAKAMVENTQRVERCGASPWGAEPPSQ